VSFGFSSQLIAKVICEGAKNVTYQIELKKNAVRARSSPSLSTRTNIKCHQLPKGTKAMVLKECPKSNFVLVEFSSDDWWGHCGKFLGVNRKPQVYLSSAHNLFEEIKEGEDNPGFNSLLQAKVQGKVFDYCDKCSPRYSKKLCPLLGVFEKITFDRCSEEVSDIKALGKSYKKNRMKCGFHELVAQARKAGKCVKGEAVVMVSGEFTVIKNKRTKTCEKDPRHADDLITDKLGRKKCVVELRKQECKLSPWRNLNLKERFQQIVKRGQKYAQRYGVDARVFPCISARETSTLEPMSKTDASCYGLSTAQGLGHITDSTHSDYWKNRGFRSRVAPYDKEPFISNRKLLFNAMSTSVDLQLEMLAFTFREKMRVSGYNMQKAISNYYGTTNAPSYRHRVYGCYKCVIDAQNETGDRFPVKCLNHVYRRPKSQNIVNGFNNTYRKLCPVESSRSDL